MVKSKKQSRNRKRSQEARKEPSLSMLSTAGSSFTIASGNLTYVSQINVGTTVAGHAGDGLIPNYHRVTWKGFHSIGGTILGTAQVNYYLVVAQNGATFTGGTSAIGSSINGILNTAIDKPFDYRTIGSFQIGRNPSGYDTTKIASSDPFSLNLTRIFRQAARVMEDHRTDPPVILIVGVACSADNSLVITPKGTLQCDFDSLARRAVKIS